MITMISCMAKNNVIGFKGKIPWHIKEEFAHFKNETMGKTLLMGKTTFEGIGKPLPGRKHIVLSDVDVTYPFEEVEVYRNLEDVLNRFKNSEEELMICGGASIYRLFLEYADKIVLSVLPDEYEGDTYFPNIGDDFSIEKEENKRLFNVITYRRIK